MAAKNTRDDFPAEVIRTLAQRAGTICSNPDCRRPTAGPTTDPSDWTNVGVAAHIYGAADGSARYEKNMTPEQRRDIANGIWLCQTCGKMIDDDARRYPPRLLAAWVTMAEHAARTAIESGTPVNTARADRHAKFSQLGHFLYDFEQLLRRCVEERGSQAVSNASTKLFNKCWTWLHANIDAAAAGQFKGAEPSSDSMPVHYPREQAGLYRRIRGRKEFLSRLADDLRRTS